MKRRLYWSGILFTVAVLAVSVSSFSQREPLRVLASNGVRAALQDLIPQWERAIGRPLTVEFDPSAAIKRKIEANEPFDVTVLTTDVLDSLAQEGKLAAHGRGKIGRIGVGVGVVAGTAKPDIRTADAIKQELLNARSMTWGEEGASRPAIDRMIKELGVADRLKPKVRLTKNVDQSMELVRTGQADLVITAELVEPFHLFAASGRFQCSLLDAGGKLARDDGCYEKYKKRHPILRICEVELKDRRQEEKVEAQHARHGSNDGLEQTPGRRHSKSCQ